ncbi:MAG: YqhA family protein [Magnetococcales bacterium]|nr:YqhA family protein [Magnetococcales bacterium]
MLRFLMPIRFFSMIAALFAFLGALIMFFEGAHLTLEAGQIYFGLIEPHGYPQGAAKGELTTLILIEALDAFLFALVVMIFGYGIVLLFVVDRATFDIEKAPKWMRFENLGELKAILAQVIIVMLYVRFLKMLMELDGPLDWELLVLPISVVLLSLGLKLLHGGHK